MKNYNTGIPKWHWSETYFDSIRTRFDLNSWVLIYDGCECRQFPLCIRSPMTSPVMGDCVGMDVDSPVSVQVVPLFSQDMGDCVGVNIDSPLSVYQMYQWPASLQYRWLCGVNVDSTPLYQTYQYEVHALISSIDQVWRYQTSNVVLLYYIKFKSYYITFWISSHGMLAKTLPNCNYDIYEQCMLWDLRIIHNGPTGMWISVMLSSRLPNQLMPETAAVS